MPALAGAENETWGKMRPTTLVSWTSQHPESGQRKSAFEKGTEISIKAVVSRLRGKKNSAVAVLGSG